MKNTLLEYGAMMVNSDVVNAPVVLQIVPRVSDHPDGVTDYALNLAKALLADYRLRTVFATAEPHQTSRNVEFEITSLANVRALPARPAHLILHYVNYGYQKRGIPFSLLPVLRALRANCHGHFLVIFHELFASGPPWRSEFWVQPLQKKIARAVARLADGVLVSSESMREMLTRLGPRLDAVVHPVPSAFGEPMIDPAQLRARDNHRWVICGGTAVIERSLRSFLPIADAIPSNVAPRDLVVVGGTDNRRVRQLLKRLANVHSEYYPAISPETASKLLSSCTFAWLDYLRAGSENADLLLKSSSFANLCAHAVVCATPPAAKTVSLKADSLPGPFVIAPDEVTLPSGNQRTDIAQAIFDWYHRHASVATLSRLVAEQLV